MPDSLSPDSDLGARLEGGGWRTVYLGPADGDRPTLGEHRPDYTAAYTYGKFLVEGARLRHPAARHGLFWGMGVLEESGHPLAPLAQLALGHGFFLRSDRDEIRPSADDPRAAWLAALLAGEGRCPEPPLLTLDRYARLRDVFDRFLAGGESLGLAHASATVRQVFGGLAGARHNWRALVAKVALGHGLLMNDEDRRRLGQDRQAFGRFMVFSLGSRSTAGDAARARSTRRDVETTVAVDPAAVNRLSVLIVEAGSREAVETTRRSLARQADLPFEIAIITDVADLKRTIAAGGTAFVTIVQAGTVLFPGALRALHAELEATPDLAMVDALALPSDAEGRVSREDARAHARAARHGVPRRPTQALPTFRREAVRRPGTLHGSSVDAAVSNAARQLSDRNAARRLPEFLCARPSRPADVERHRTSLGGRLGTALHRFRTTPLWGPIRRAPTPYEVVSALARLTTRRTRRTTRGRRDGDARRGAARRGGEARIAYVLWRYPTRSETFIRREIQALRGAGIAIEVLALEPDNPPLPEDPASPAGAVTYFGPTNPRRRQGRPPRCGSAQPLDGAPGLARLRRAPASGPPQEMAGRPR